MKEITNQEKKQHEESAAFVRSLPQEIIDAATREGFFIPINVTGHPDALMPVVDEKLDGTWQQWYIRLKTFVAGYKSDSAGQVN